MKMQQILCRLTSVGISAVMLAASVPALPARAAQTLTVGKNGTYQTVGQAVQAAAALNPAGESSRVTIAIEPGVYREQLLINTPYLTFTNSNPNAGEVKLTWYYGIGYKYYSADSKGYYSASAAAAKSAKNAAARWGTAVRLQENAKYFRAENITFENSFNRYVTDEELADGVEPTGETLTVQRNKGSDVKAKSMTERAAALCAEADCCEFYKCTFLGSQDTLYTAKQAYFRECKIQGNTDYIFGSGDVVFDACELCFGGYSDNAVGGYITAARAQTNGYLFWECAVTANPGMKVGAGYFGRPWKETAHVLFYNTKLQYEGIIDPVGWHSMSGVEPSQATFREYNTKTVSGGNVNTGSRTGGTVLYACDATREQYFGGWTPYYYNFTGSKLKPSTRLELSSMSFYLKNVGSGLYLGVEGSAQDGANIIQTSKEKACVWIPEGFGEGYYWLYADGGDGTYFDESYMILSVDGDDPANGTNISIVKQCDGDGKFFKFVSAGGGAYELVTKNTEDQSCVSVSGGSKDSGANVLQSECSGSEDQKWIIEEKVEPLRGHLIRELYVYDREHADSWTIEDCAYDGCMVFGDRDVACNNLPNALDGAEMIRTACDSKHSTGTLAEVVADNDPVTLYVAMDTRVDPLPEWLNDWEQTDLTFGYGDDVTMRCFAKNLGAGEHAMLGENGQSSYCVNYAVFVAPRIIADFGTTTHPETTTTMPETTTTIPETTTTEPEATTTTTPTVTEPAVTEPEAETTVSVPPVSVMRGDTDCSGEVDVSDAVLAARFTVEDPFALITEQGKSNGDVDGNGTLDPADVIRILKIIAHLV